MKIPVYIHKFKEKKDFLKVSVEAKGTLQNLYFILLDEIPDKFYFVDSQGHRLARSQLVSQALQKKQGKKIIYVKIHAPEPESESESEPESESESKSKSDDQSEKSQKQDDKDTVKISVKVVDRKAKTTLMKASVDQEGTLSTLAKSIKGEIQKEFHFVDAQGTRLGNAHPLKQVIEGDQGDRKVFIDFDPVDKDKKDDKKFQSQMKSYKRIQKRKQIFQKAINEVKALQKQTIQNKIKAEQLGQARLQRLRERLSEVGITLDDNVTQQALERCRKSAELQLQDSENHLEKLRTMAPVSFKEHLRYFDSIGKSYFHGQACQEKILDMNNIEWDEDKQRTGFHSEQRNFYTKSSLAETSQKFSQNTASVNLTVIGLTPQFLVQGSVSYTHEQQQSQAKATNNQCEYSASSIFGIYIGKTASFTEDSVVVKDYVCQKFIQLFERYQENGPIPSVSLIKDIFQFFKKYGYEVDLGHFVFGSTYRLTSEATFTSKIQSTKASQVAQDAVGGSIAFGSLCVAGQLEGHYATASGQEKLSKDQKIDYQTKTDFTANPSIARLDNWKQLVELSCNYWRVLAQEIRKVKLLDIFRNSQRAASKFRHLDPEKFDIFMMCCEIVYNNLCPNDKKGPGFKQMSYDVLKMPTEEDNVNWFQNK